MKKSLTLCLLFGSLLSFGQSIPNGNFNQYETIQCPFDSTTTINAYQDWFMYQTLDGNWNGPLDSTVCISLKDNPDDGIDIQTFDLARPIFIRCKLTDDNKIWMEPDILYYVSAGTQSWGGNTAQYNAGTNCPGNFCSGFTVGIEVPDETGNSTNTRWYTDIPDGLISYGGFESCLPTEYFPNNYLREFIVKLFPLASTTLNEKIKMSYAYASPEWDFNYVNDVVAPQSTFNGVSYNVPIYDVAGWSGSYLLHYTSTSSYPSFTSPSYVEGRPEVNSSDPQTINLSISEWQTLVPQPFVFLRGALVEGSDTIRHTLNLINFGGDICLSTIIDFVIEDNNKYIHAGGHVNMEGLNSCMMFRNGGTLEVADGVTMQYGQDGRGIMALRSGGQVKLGKGSTLLFNGLLWLQGVPTAKHPDPQFYLDLRPGNALVFGEGASIYNGNSTAPDVKLNVYMNGGTLDDSQLTPGARLLINRIYPKPSKRFAENVKLLQNPTIGGATIGYTAAGNERVLVEVHDLQGRLAVSKSYEATEGLNSFEVDLGGAAAGVYMATVSANGGRASMKIVRI